MSWLNITLGVLVGVGALSVLSPIIGTGLALVALAAGAYWLYTFQPQKSLS